METDSTASPHTAKKTARSPPRSQAAPPLQENHAAAKNTLDSISPDPACSLRPDIRPHHCAPTEPQTFPPKAPDHSAGSQMISPDLPHTIRQTPACNSSPQHSKRRDICNSQTPR